MGHYRARIHWLDRKTGQEGVYVEPDNGAYGSLWDDPDDGQISMFQWDEGSYGCDYNRAIFFLGQDLFASKCVDPECPDRFVITQMEALNAAGELVVDLDYDERRQP